MNLHVTFGNRDCQRVARAATAQGRRRVLANVAAKRLVGSAFGRHLGVGDVVIGVIVGDESRPGGGLDACHPLGRVGF